MSSVIYGLFDPRVNPLVIRYIGFTSKGADVRLREHLTEARSGIQNHKCNWIRSVMTDGITPNVIVIEDVESSNWQTREQHWIALYKNSLTNQTAGGEGLINPSAEVRKRIGDTLRPMMLGNSYRLGIAHTEESKAAIRSGMAASGKQKLSIIARAGIAIPRATEAAAIANRGTPKSESHRAKLSMAHIGVSKVLGYKWINNEQVEKLIPKDSALLEGFTFGRLKR